MPKATCTIVVDETLLSLDSISYLRFIIIFLICCGLIKILFFKKIKLRLIKVKGKEFLFVVIVRFRLLATYFECLSLLF